jgi:hypothetical protein
MKCFITSLREGEGGGGVFFLVGVYSSTFTVQLY